MVRSNRFEKSDSRIRIILVDIFKITECVQLGVVADEDLELTHAAMTRR